MSLIETEMRFAVLIDGDNSSHQRVNQIMEELARFGTATIKRIYGDFTTSNLDGWKKQLLENAITPVQQFAYTTGKNATDSAMIIDAMDILYANRVEGFCLVSSDSDFTRLAMRLREAGKYVIGMGKSTTPEPFIKACDRFIYLQVLSNQTVKKVMTAKTKNKVIQMIDAAINDVEDDDSWAQLSQVGNNLNRKYPQFDARNYGFTKLSALVNYLKVYEVDERSSSSKTRAKQLFIRKKREK